MILKPQQVFVVLFDSILNAAVAFFLDPKLEPKFEVTILLSGDDVAAFSRQMQNPVRFKRPAFRYWVTIGFHPMPHVFC